jgi:hypothetical protein
MHASLQEQILILDEKLACRKNAANLLLLELPYSDPPKKMFGFLYQLDLKYSLIIFFDICFQHYEFCQHSSNS